jgi:hypothetical protein
MTWKRGHDSHLPYGGFAQAVDKLGADNMRTRLAVEWVEVGPLDHEGPGVTAASSATCFRVGNLQPAESGEVISSDPPVDAGISRLRLPPTAGP